MQRNRKSCQSTEISKGRIYCYWEGKKKHTHYQFQYIHGRGKVTHHHQWGHYRKYDAIIKQELHTSAINHQHMRLGKYKASQPQAPSVATVHPTAFKTLEEFQGSVIQCLILPHNQLDLLTFLSSLCVMVYRCSPDVLAKPLCKHLITWICVVDASTGFDNSINLQQLMVGRDEGEEREK